jgi:hypothetical protein
MKRPRYTLSATLAFSDTVCAADDVASAVAGTVKKVDSAAKTLVVNSDDHGTPTNG